MEERDEETRAVGSTPTPPPADATSDSDESSSGQSQVMAPNVPEESMSSQREGTLTRKPALFYTPTGELIYEVEQIVNKSVVNGITYYKVKWVGYNKPEDDTWEPVENLTGCRTLVLEFEKRLKSDETTQAGKESVKLPAHQGLGANVTEAGAGATASQDNPETSALRRKLAKQALIDCMESFAMGPMFRPVWRDGEIPVGILGSNKDTGRLIHLVRIKRSADEPDPEDIFEGLDAENAVMVLADAFSRRFPTMTVNYYEEHSVWVTPEDIEEETATKAARAMLAHTLRTTGADTSQIYADMMTPSAARNVDEVPEPKEPEETKQDSAPDEGRVVGNDENDGSAHVNLQLPNIDFSAIRQQAGASATTDKFGLPLSMTSSSESNDSSDEETINVWKTDEEGLRNPRMATLKVVKALTKPREIKRRRALMIQNAMKVLPETELMASKALECKLV